MEIADRERSTERNMKERRIRRVEGKRKEKKEWGKEQMEDDQM